MADASYRTIVFKQLGSTNDEALARLRAGDPGGLFVVAASQIGGRGRQGRAWASPPGNLYASLALVDPASLAVAPQLGLLAGLALVSALRALSNDDPRLGLKWPNDVLLDGAKLAGILLESTTLADGRLGCVVGFGVNCASHPNGLSYPATSLAAAGIHASPTMVLTALSEAFAATLTLWARGTNFAAIRAEWLRFAVGLGDEITVVLPRGPVSGRFKDLGPDGRLLVETTRGRVTIDAGDVFLPGLVAGAMHQITEVRTNVASEGLEGT